MQSRAFIRRSPQVCRIVKAIPCPTSSRSMSLFSPTPFIVRGSAYPSHPFASLEREVAPLFRMMDDLNRTFENHFLTSTPNARVAQAPAPFQPRFDVREVDGAYELRGELPGVESKDVEVEFTDAQTLLIRGRTESETTSGTPPVTQSAKDTEAAEPTTNTTTNAVADDGGSTHSTSSYQKASVEDEATEAASTPGQAPPAESTTSEAPQQSQSNGQVTPAEPAGTPYASKTVANANTNTQAQQYWVTERRTGSFQRVFTFPGKINQEGVTASLKNGVLDIVVPKAVAHQPRRISVL